MINGQLYIVSIFDSFTSMFLTSQDEINDHLIQHYLKRFNQNHTLDITAMILLMCYVLSGETNYVWYLGAYYTIKWLRYTYIKYIMWMWFRMYCRILTCDTIGKNTRVNGICKDISTNITGLVNATNIILNFGMEVTNFDRGEFCLEL